MTVRPTYTEHEGVIVVRDDLYPGGTKARYFAGLFEQHDHVVYASPAEGGAQTALAFAAREAGKRCTIFVAERKNPHPRAHAAKRLGAEVILVPNGYLNVVQSRAREYCRRTGAFELPFGGAIDGAEDRIAEAARLLDVRPAEVWCAAGSGTLARGLARAWPNAELHAVQVGRELKNLKSTRYYIHKAPIEFARVSRVPCPFPSDPHYDRKAWGVCLEKCRRDGSIILFWNVTGPAESLANG